ncbi:tetratricopeptide repeat-containing diguanylate cyclase [Dyella lipolytica]|uniref:diguanylate cyclase n=1 Tax=Dyella lipolytica TaxID=1867835 RepID=A0ABW8IT06_9GAMM|nr:diguanylate cyclase [Dyella lipolytica]
MARAASLLCLLAGVAFAATPESSDSSQLLARADAIKTVDNTAFAKLLEQLDKNTANLSEAQKWTLRYLHAWELGYTGQFVKAKPELEVIARQAPDNTMRINATASLINILGFGHHYEEAFAQLDQGLDELPRVSDKNARFHLMAEAAQLLIGAGQYDLATSYTDQIIADYPDGRNGCIGRYLKVHANFLDGRMRASDLDAQQGLETCVKAGENMWTDAIRRDVANFAIQQGRIPEAIRLLQNSYANVVGYHYPELTAEYDALLAQAYWETNDSAHAEKFALDTVDIAKKDDYTQPLSTAYELLFQIARQQGDLRNAVTYREKFVAADKDHVDELREKALAYQFAKQQVEIKKSQLEELNKKNQILQLQRALDHKAVETSRLYIALLLTVLASIGFLLYRLKRSQLRFMRLARRDGLTGIFNRQHFVDEAEQALRYTAKSMRGACLILIDMDHFKLINDTHGHTVGDQVLRRAVTMCQRYLRSCDVFGRLGGEEFGILLPECTPTQALYRAEQIRAAIHATTEDEPQDIPISASFGIASADHYGYELRKLLIAADDALYSAKREGRNRVVMSETDTDAVSPSSERATG